MIPPILAKKRDELAKKYAEALYAQECCKIGYDQACTDYQELVRPLIEALEQIEFHENPNPHKQEKTLYYRLASEALDQYLQQIGEL